MIAKGNLHAHGQKLAAYLITGKMHERAELVELKGFASPNIREAFVDVMIQAEATRCEKPFYHAHVRLPDGEALRCSGASGMRAHKAGRGKPSPRRSVEADSLTVAASAAKSRDATGRSPLPSERSALPHRAARIKRAQLATSCFRHSSPLIVADSQPLRSLKNPASHVRPAGPSLRLCCGFHLGFG